MSPITISANGWYSISSDDDESTITEFINNLSKANEGDSYSIGGVYYNNVGIADPTDGSTNQYIEITDYSIKMLSSVGYWVYITNYAISGQDNNLPPS
jgi:hypothetical protein